MTFPDEETLVRHYEWMFFGGLLILLLALIVNALIERWGSDDENEQ